MNCHYCGHDIDESNLSMSSNPFSCEDEISGETFYSETCSTSGLCENCGVSSVVEEYFESYGGSDE